MNTPRQRPTALTLLAILANLIGVLSAIAAAAIAWWENQTYLSSQEATLLGLLGAFGVLQILSSFALLRLDSAGRSLQIFTSGAWLLGCAIAAATWWGTPQLPMLVIAIPGALLAAISLSYLASAEVAGVFDDAGIEASSARGLMFMDIVIAGFLLLIVYPMVRSTTARGTQAQTMTTIRSIATAAESFARDQKHFPEVRSFAELQGRLSPTYLRNMPLQDGWKNDLRFESWRTPDALAADHYAIASGGKDRRFEKRSLRDYSDRGTTDLDCDIVFRDGKFISYPAELQVKEAAQKSSDPDSLFKEATSLYWSNQYDRAIPLFIKYLKDRPDDALANARLGVSYCNVSRFQDAIPLLQKASALDKTDYQSRNNLALAYDKVGKPELGIAPAREAVALEPHNAVVNNTLGWVLLRARKDGEAIAPLALAVRLDPNEVQPHYNLALAYHGVGDEQRARQQAAIVKRLDPHSAQELEAALRQ